jgi:hypothetical protein
MVKKPLIILPGLGGGTSKSILRRLSDSRFATRYFRGTGIDIGSGADSLLLYSELFPLIRAMRTWDTEDGDAQILTGVADASFDFVYSSHYREQYHSSESRTLLV